MHHLLEINSIIKSFGARQLLADVHLKINMGNIIELFGGNGIRRSVLMQVIFGAMKVDRKFIRLDEYRIPSAPYQHARTIAFLLQQDYLPKYEEINESVDCYLGTNVVPYFCEDNEVAQPCMKRRVSQFSGGERRYSEAKLLLLGSIKLVLLGESFDYLSFHLANKLVESIKKHSEEKGTMITDHNYEKILEVVNRLVLTREEVLMELTDRRGLVEQGYLLNGSCL